jgi:hypothetical protein
MRSSFSSIVNIRALVERGNNMIDPTIIVFQFMNIAIIVLWIVVVFMALSRMRTMSFPDGSYFAWIMLIIFIPIFGAMAFLITHRRKSK